MHLEIKKPRHWKCINGRHPCVVQCLASWSTLAPLLVGCPLVGLAAACGPHWCTLVQAICLYWCTLWCSSPLLVQEATLACTGVRWISSSSQLASASKRRPVGDQPASRGELHLPLAVSTPRPPSKPPFPSPHFHLNLVLLFGDLLILSFSSLITSGGV